jgi:hypothetical protein
LPVDEVDVERSRVPYVAPLRGEHLHATAILGGEEGDNLVDDGIGLEVDAVDELFCFFQPLLHWPGDHPHGGMTAYPPAARIGEWK